MEEGQTISNNFVVYKHTFPNGKAYVGITERDPLLRWKNGNGYAGQLKIRNAILKYGWENVLHEILFSGLTKEEACEKEKQLIKEFDSVENGYNVSTGGEYGSSGAYKYKNGEVYGNFKVLGRDGHKIILECVDCGNILKRRANSLQNNCVKCECKTAYKKTKKRPQITFNGKTQSATKWSKELGIPTATIWGRYKKGQPIDKPQNDHSWKTERICPQCGEVFVPRMKEQKYCGNDCAHKAAKKERGTRVCAFCGKEFEVTRSINSNYRAMFCGVPCRVKFQQG